MDLDKALVYSIVTEGRQAVMRAKEMGITPDFLKSAEASTALAFVYEYVSTYDGVPTPDLVEGKTGVTLDSATGEAAFFIDEVRNRDLHSKLKEGILDAIASLEAHKPRECLEKIETLAMSMRQQHLGVSKITLIGALGKSVMDHYDKLKAGYTGILTPWKALNDVTLGLWPQDLALFVARLGVGKTWISLLLAKHAWNAGHKVMYATTEMSQVRIAQRFFSVNFKIPYREFRTGKLSSFVEDKVRAEILSVSADDRMHVVGGNFDFKVESLMAAVDQVKPDILFLDGAYLLKTAGANRFEQAAVAFNEPKRLANSYEIPVVATSQFNRDAGKAKSGTGSKVENIALTDVAGWNADLIFGLTQTDDMKKDKRMVLKPLKVREGEGMDIELNWNIDEMDFEELPTSGTQSVDFDTGVEDSGSSSSADDLPF